jgi:predicted ester cyclase
LGTWPPTREGGAVSTDRNKATARTWIEQSWTDAADSAAEELIAPDAIFHEVGGREQILEAVAMFRAGISNVAISIDDQVAEGDKVVTRWSVRGTHTGDLLGTPATGSEVTYGGITIDRFVAGRIVEDSYESDHLGVMEQIRSKQLR